MTTRRNIHKYTFDTKKILGEGSYATVYKGYTNDTKEPRALKIVDYSSYSKEQITQLENEVKHLLYCQTSSQIQQQILSFTSMMLLPLTGKNFALSLNLQLVKNLIYTQQDLLLVFQKDCKTCFLKRSQ